MTKLKKAFLAAVLALCVLFSVAACGNKTPLSITVSEAKTEYVVGDPLDLRGGKITVNYKSKTETVNMTKNDGSLTDGVSTRGFDSSTPATEQVITVEYLGLTDTFTITISESTENYESLRDMLADLPEIDFSKQANVFTAQEKADSIAAFDLYLTLSDAQKNLITESELHLIYSARFGVGYFEAAALLKSANEAYYDACEDKTAFDEVEELTAQTETAVKAYDDLANLFANDGDFVLAADFDITAALNALSVVYGNLKQHLLILPIMDYISLIVQLDYDTDYLLLFAYNQRFSPEIDKFVKGSTQYSLNFFLNFPIYFDGENEYSLCDIYDSFTTTADESFKNAAYYYDQFSADAKRFVWLLIDAVYTRKFDDSFVAGNADFDRDITDMRNILHSAGPLDKLDLLDFQGGAYYTFLFEHASQHLSDDALTAYQQLATRVTRRYLVNFVYEGDMWPFLQEMNDFATLYSALTIGEQQSIQTYSIEFVYYKDIFESLSFSLGQGIQPEVFVFVEKYTMIWNCIDAIYYKDYSYLLVLYPLLLEYIAQNPVLEDFLDTVALSTEGVPYSYRDYIEAFEELYDEFYIDYYPLYLEKYEELFDEYMQVATKWITAGGFMDALNFDPNLYDGDFYQDYLGLMQKYTALSIEDQLEFLLRLELTYQSMQRDYFSNYLNDAEIEVWYQLYISFIFYLEGSYDFFVDFMHNAITLYSGLESTENFDTYLGDMFFFYLDAYIERPYLDKVLNPSELAVWQELYDAYCYYVEIESGDDQNLESFIDIMENVVILYNGLDSKRMFDGYCGDIYQLCLSAYNDYSN